MVAVKNAETTREVVEFAQLPPRDEIAAHHLIDEQRLLDRLIERAVFSEDERRRSTELARRLVYAARADRGKHAGVDAFMREYGLSSEEGVILMCIAEALLRIPDSRDGRRAHRRKAFRRTLGKASRPVRQPAGQRLHLGADAHRAHRQAARSARRQSVRRPEAPRRPLRRAGHPPGRPPGGEGAGRSVRARAHHSRSAGACQGVRGERLSVLLRHARRGRAHAEGRRYLLRALPGGDRRGRPGGGAVLDHARRRTVQPPGAVDQAVGPASALRARQGRAPRRRAQPRAC